MPDEDFPPADVLIDGPPCPGFSALNRKRDGDHRRRLWEEYVRALVATRADYFVMENVPQLLKSPEFDEFKAQLDSKWEVDEGILVAADYGVPQVRKRAFALGSRRGAVKLPAPTHAAPDAPRPLQEDCPGVLTQRR